MADIPFLNPTILKQLDLPVPNRDTTPLLLEALNLNREYIANKEIKSYQRLYGFDQLDCQHWQGYIKMPLFKLHVQVFKPKTEKIKGAEE